MNTQPETRQLTELPLHVSPAVVADMDGTLADCTHRRHFVEPPSPPDWPAFNRGCVKDTVNVPVVNTFHALQNVGYVGLIVTGRGEEYREATLDWLTRYYVNFSRLYMRPAKDYRPDTEIKLEILAQIVEDGYEPFIALDDRDSVVKMWRGQRSTCLPGAEGNF